MVSSDAVDEKWANYKLQIIEQQLGPQHDTVMHAIIPYAVGGGLDLYYYPKCPFGTAIATLELSPQPRTGPANDFFAAYEWAMFTHHPMQLDEAFDETTAFGRAHTNIQAILNVMAPYSEQASLNPFETCEFPAEAQGLGGKCFVLDALHKDESRRLPFGLMVVIEIFRSELEFARQHSTAELIALLKDNHIYPCSDLDRRPVDLV